MGRRPQDRGTTATKLKMIFNFTPLRYSFDN